MPKTLKQEQEAVARALAEKEAASASTAQTAAITATVAPPVPITITDVKEAKLTAGDIVPVPLAPKTGTIPQAAGTIVAVVLKKFTKSRTIQVAGLVILLGVGYGLAEFKHAMDAALAAGKHIFEIPWGETGFKALDSAYKFFVGGGAMILMKLLDNDPANPPGADGGDATDSG